MKILITIVMSVFVLTACSEKKAEQTQGEAVETAQIEQAVNQTEVMEKPESEEEQKFPVIFIIAPKDGEQVISPFTVSFGAKNIDIVPAGTDQENSGHHHLIINGELPDFTKPMGSEVQHFGQAQTETELSLAPGKHTLQLILGDMTHTPHSPPIYSEPITIEVLE